MTTPMSSPLDGNGVAAAEAAFNASINNPQMVPCSKCEGRGFHHGFGEDGNDPDWCTECGGNQFNVVPGEETRAIEAAVAAYLAAAAPSQTAVEPVAELVERLRSVATDEELSVADHATVVEAASALTAQAAALAKAEGRVEALMAERTSLIATKREQLAAAESEVATLKARIAELEAWKADALEALNPLGEYATTIEGNYAMPLPDNLCPTPAFPLSMFRAARRLTHQEKNNG